MARVIVQVPTYCERDNLEVLIPALLALPGNLHVLVVDDASPDGTGPWLKQLEGREKRVHGVLRAGKLGYASATLDGFRRALELGADVIVTMDADLSHDPSAVPGLLGRLEEADLVLGSRYLGGCRVLNWSVRRLLVSLFANWYAGTLLRLPFADVTSGFRAYRSHLLRDTVDLRVLSSGGYSVLVELVHRLYRADARIVEHPIIYSERREGQSKMSKRVILEAAALPLLLRLERLLPPLRRRSRSLTAPTTCEDGDVHGERTRRA